MKLENIGHVGGDLYVTGTSYVPVYLLQAERPALFDAGLSCMGSKYVRSITDHLKGQPPVGLFLSHVHFDHCGAVSQLKQAFPGLAIAASTRGAEIIVRPNAIKLIKRLSKDIYTQMDHMDGLEKVEFEAFQVDTVLNDGDEISLDDQTTVRAIHTPGHTRDFLSYYIPERKILIASEAVGCLNRTGYIVVDYLIDFETYISSLKRLAELDVEILAQGHQYVFTGDDAAQHIQNSLDQSYMFRDLIGELWQTHGDLVKVMAEARKVEFDPQPRPRQSEAAYLINLEARSKAALRSLAHDGKIAWSD